MTRSVPTVTDSELAAGQRALHVEDGGTWFTGSHRVLRLRPEEVHEAVRQSDAAAASAAQSLREAEEACKRAIQRTAVAAAAAKPTEAATDRSDRIGHALAVLAVLLTAATVIGTFPF